MDAPEDFDIQASWRRLLIEIELAKNVWTLGGPNDGPVPNKPVLDALFSPLLYLRAASLLDESLATHIKDRGYSLSGSSLHARLVCLDANGALPYTNELRALKDRRNLVAHRSDPTAQNTVTWDDLDAAVSVIEAALQHLRLIGPRPTFTFFAERKVDLYNERRGELHPTKPEVSMTQHFRYGVREDANRLAEWRISFDFMRIEAPAGK